MYTSEKEMVCTFKARSQDFMAQVCPNTSINPRFILEEFDSYNGIPDLVIGTFSTSILSSGSRTAISKNWVFPLIHLTVGDVIALDGFSNSYSVTQRTAKNVLESYEVAGFIKKLGKHEYEVIRKYEILTKSVISIEGKLKNWRRALLQAQRYKRFSNLSFVVLEKKHSKCAINNIALFLSNNIGLASMEEEDYTIHHMPTWSDTRVSEYVLRLHEAAYSSYVSNVTTC